MIVFEPEPKQQELINHCFTGNKTIITIAGSIRSGKTYGMCAAAILLAKIYKGSKWAMLRENRVSLRDKTIPSFFKVCPSNFIQNYNQQDLIVHCKNDSQVLFFPEQYASDKEYDRFKGLEVNGFFIDQIEEIQESTFNKCIERAGSHIIPGLKQQPKPIIVCNQNVSFGWTRQRFIEPWIAGKLPDNYVFIEADIEDNEKYNPPEYLKNLRDSMTETEYEVFVKHNWALSQRTGGEFYAEYAYNKHVRKLTYDKDLPIHISFDQNVVPYITCIISQIRKIDEVYYLHIIEELCLKNPRNTTERLCQEILYRYPEQKMIYYYGDASGRKSDTRNNVNDYEIVENVLKEKLQPHSCRVPFSNPPVIKRRNFINKIFAEVKTIPIRITIDESCRNLITDMECLKEDADGTKRKETTQDRETKQSYEKYGHASDALDYLLTSAFERYFDA